MLTWRVYFNDEFIRFNCTFHSPWLRQLLLAVVLVRHPESLIQYVTFLSAMLEWLPLPLRWVSYFQCLQLACSSPCYVNLHSVAENLRHVTCAPVSLDGLMQYYSQRTHTFNKVSFLLRHITWIYAMALCQLPIFVKYFFRFMFDAFCDNSQMIILWLLLRNADWKSWNHSYRLCSHLFSLNGNILLLPKQVSEVR